MGAAKKRKKTTKNTKKPKPADGEEDPRTAELTDLLHEHAVIKDRIDALAEMATVRKNRILMIMNELGVGRHECAAGHASFTRRRSFKVHDPARLSELMTKTQLASNCKITADVYDACVAEEVAIDEAVTVGRSESLSVSRATTKDAKKRREGYINESKRQAEERISALRAQLRSGA